jgi:membrane-bound lytic murein transglycosylase F
LLLVACGDPQPPLLKESAELLVLTREGPTTYTQDNTGAVSGFEHDLVQLFAEELGLPVKFIVVRHDTDIGKKLKKGKAHFGAAWLTTPTDPALIAGPSYYASSNVIAQNENTLPVDTPDDLTGKSVQVLARSRQATVLRELSKRFPDIQISEHKSGTELELLAPRCRAAGRVGTGRPCRARYRLEFLSAIAICADTRQLNTDFVAVSCAD